MAHKTVQAIIGRILTDDELRAQFMASPLETLTSLRDMGLDLTTVEIEALADTDHQLWQSGPEWIDSRLQRCGLVTRTRAR